MDSIKHLEPNEIRYLALEGGGGKGFAYLGAIQVLEALEVMTHIDGVSGTSAGAITALMLALGMSAEEIERELITNDFNTFFDPPYNSLNKRRVPMPFKYIDRENSALESFVLAGSRDPLQFVRLQKAIKDLSSPFARGLMTWAWILKLQGVAGKSIRELLAEALKRYDITPLDVLLRYLPDYLTYLERDMGLFSGEAARSYLDGLIFRRMRTRFKNMRNDLPSIPFIIFQKIFKRDLLVTGTNLATGKTVLFSHRHTPYFPVADAVRISMGLPLIFKPYVIEKETPGWPPCGTYIDGGLWNNLPFREISNLQLSETPSESISAATTPPPDTPAQRQALSMVIKSRQTLGLRLGIDIPQPVLKGGVLLAKVLETVSSAGESQVIEDLQPFTIVLDTEGLSTLVFNPDDLTKEKVGKRSRRATYRYFGKEPPKADEDLKDDERIKNNQLQSVCNPNASF